MVVLNRIYTKTGDKGDTALGSGVRVPKNDLRIEAYGTVDEANSVIGVARLTAFAELDGMLGRIQNDMFDLGADLCLPETPEPPPYEPLRMVEAQTTRLEHEIDQMNGHLTPLRSFILPGGTACAAHLHVARTVCRRAERLMVALAAKEPVNPFAITYANRLSDFLFVAARFANLKGPGDVLWTPGANRK
ncbi:MAG TPA: cob(I)yrinic acid a,c-diamide adenosyltransferase [Alphaproteobacteria bacterium]|nr:cob(I)yrinic acid a,c-diamide adenosyltransferase [Alphaproteobacteria bacterium]HAJ45111.1 cob(I)yrinic acid a,c-diamide adenosyltransferase [Alphaproteobacteria bacterium]